MVTTWDGSGAKRDQQPSQRASCASTDPGQFVPRMMPRSWEAGVQPPGAALCSCSLGSWTPSAAPSLAGLAVAAHRPSPRTPGPHHGFASRISAQTGTALRPSPSSTRGPPASRPALNGNAVSSELAQHLCGLSGAPALPLDQTQPTATVWPIGRRPSPRGSVFIQVVQGQVTNPDALRAELDRWKVELQPGADEWLGSTSGVTDDGRFIAVVRFVSEELPTATATGPSRMPGGARHPSTWPRSPSTTPRGCTSIGRAVGPGWLCPGDPGPQRGHGAPGWPWPGPGADHGRAGPAHPWHDRG